MAFGYQVLGFGSAPAAEAVAWYGDRGIVCGSVSGGGASFSDVIEYFTISSAGNSTDFGDLTAIRHEMGGCGNGTRMVVGGGSDSGYAALNEIEYWAFATLGNGTDFGDLTVARQHSIAALSDGIKGVWGGGYSGSLEDTIDYVLISTLGNATDFGNLTDARRHIVSGCSDGIKGVFAGGEDSGGGQSSIIDYIVIATLGNATDFGDMAVDTYGGGSCANTVRGVFVGGSG